MRFFDHLIHLDYSSDLHALLKGFNCDENIGSSIYQFMGIMLLLVSFLFMLNYYYGLFNNPRFTHRRTWLVNIGVACCIVGLAAYINAVRFLPPEKHCADMHFTAVDCMLFAFTEMIYTAIACIVFSLLLKWKSVANKKIPF